MAFLARSRASSHSFRRALSAVSAFRVQLRVRAEHVHVGRRVVHHLREDHRPRRRQRPPRPPQVQRARVSVADRLLPRRGLVDGLERQGDFDELLGGLHSRSLLVGFEIRRHRRARDAPNFLPQMFLPPREERLVVITQQRRVRGGRQTVGGQHRHQTGTRTCS